MHDDETLVSRCYPGKPARVLRNAFTDAWKGHESEILPMPAQMDLVRPLVEPAKNAGDMEVGNWPTGQGAVLVKQLRPAGELVHEIVAEAEAALGRFIPRPDP
jgi:enoyl-[acyl-carrier protein] reductase II